LCPGCAVSDEGVEMAHSFFEGHCASGVEGFAVAAALTRGEGMVFEDCMLGFDFSGFRAPRAMDSVEPHRRPIGEGAAFDPWAQGRSSQEQP
jgi:hypothetical protein